ncbi:hypothetical protein chiPu_0002589 [Chiloscyllium punctatum]|uniref:Uncharacterized protein n=1 Tax=Chiloscyllium punctatum TaxID=137246 RepID=A0A401S1C6_CHIPU|nr:hypothetical protein [Chiloscyllium punctatum]
MEDRPYMVAQSYYGFEADDFEKTLVVPGYSSFLIVRVNSSNLVLAYATMPLLTIYYVLIEEENWFLYDFSSRNGTWRIYENECYTWIEAANNVHLNPFVLLDLNDTVNFEFKFSTRKAGSQVFKITVGNPHLIQISSKSRWDETGLSILNLVVTSNFNLRGYTTILVTIPEASLLCPITCLAIIVQCSCPARKAIVYLSHKYVSEHEWLHGLSENSTIEFNFLKELPVNYRPPSTFGINLPVSENIYNADPSKPKYRNFYELSKKTGRYKQCAMKKTREECGCTDEMRLSSFVQYSDCRQRVRALLIDEKISSSLFCIFALHCSPSI